MHISAFFLPGAAWRRVLACAAGLALGWTFAAPAAAADVTVFAATAFAPVVVAMKPVFEQRTGDRLVVVGGTADALTARIRAGESFDVAVLPPALLETLGGEGAVSDGSIVALARAGAAQNPAVYAGAVSAQASNSSPALSLLILLASEDTQAALKGQGLQAP